MAADLAEVPRRVAAVRDALERGQTQEAEACVGELQQLLRALRARGASCTAAEAEVFRASLLECLQSAQGRRQALAGQLQQAGSARSAIDRYGR